MELIFDALDDVVYEGGAIGLSFGFPIHRLLKGFHLWSMIGSLLTHMKIFGGFFHQSEKRIGLWRRRGRPHHQSHVPPIGETAQHPTHPSPRACNRGMPSG